jgi:hypothetical protein
MGVSYEFFVMTFVDFSYCDSNQYQPSQPLILLDCISLEIWLVSIKHMSEYVLFPLCYISNGMMLFFILFKKNGFCVMYQVAKGGY